MGKRALLLSMLLLCGCAGTDDCAGDAFQLGARDGRMSYGGQPERYAARCGASFDAARYEAGYRQGASQRPHVPSF
jgi:hypothetical protein